LEGQADSDMNCTVGNGSPSPEEATAGSWGPWVGIAADALDPERSGTSLPTESEAEALAACRRVERRVELIESKRKKQVRGFLVRVFAGTKLRRGP
jgi:hypothetical protein